MKRFFLFGGAFATGMAAAMLAAGLMLLPGWFKDRQLQALRPEVAPAAAPEPAPQPDATPAPTLEPLPQLDFTALQARNADVAGWLTIEETPVDFPVVQGRDNDFYLRHDLDKQPDPEGIPYLDYECDLESSGQLIIYGHNMGKGKTDRFSSLQNYRDPAYYARHPVIQFSTPGSSQRYKVAAVLPLTARTDDPDYFAFNQDLDLSDGEAAGKFLEEVRARAFYTAGEMPRPGERLLSLCLCTYEMEDARLVVVARPIREGEGLEADPVTENPAPRLPARWPAEG